MGNLARLALVANVETSEKLQDLDILGTYHLLLAHKVLEQPDRFKRFYHTLRANIPATFIIMDNSAVELQKHGEGETLSTHELVEACEIVHADVLTLPDVLGDSDATVVESSQAMQELDKHLPHWCNYMAVAQGKTVQEAVTTIERLRTRAVTERGYTRLRTVAVPRLLVDHIGSRSEVIRKLKRHYLPIHLFGFSDNMRDDVECTRMALVQGIDSAVPVRCGLERITIENPDVIVPKRTTDYLNYTGPLTVEVKFNVKNFTNWIANGPPRQG